MSWYQGCETFVREQAPLAGLTSYRVGGPAEFYAEPPDAQALARLLRRAAAARQQVRVLGRGTNLLVADAGVKGLVLRLPQEGFGALERDGRLVRAGAALGLPALVNWSVAQGLSGLECLPGIPGCVGGALRMNAGGKHEQIGKRVRRVFGVEREGASFEVGAAECGFTYRGSKLEGRIVTSCELELAVGDKTAGRMRLAAAMAEKAASQPLAACSAGCVFKNPSQPHAACAGKLIDELGLKGLRVGGASISRRHANFLICEDHALARDLAQLIQFIRLRAYEAHGVLLELEIEPWGFEAEELLPPGWDAGGATAMPALSHQRHEEHRGTRRTRKILSKASPCASCS